MTLSENLNDYCFLLEGNSFNKLPYKFLKSDILMIKLEELKTQAESFSQMEFFNKLIVNLLVNSVVGSDVKEYMTVLNFFEPGSDINLRHPILHEVAHQITYNPKLFVAVWSHEKFLNFVDDKNYIDTYGLNAKQRLALSLESLKYRLNEISRNYKDSVDNIENDVYMNYHHCYEYCEHVLKVKPCNTEYNHWGQIIPPKDYLLI